MNNFWNNVGKVLGALADAVDENSQRTLIKNQAKEDPTVLGILYLWDSDIDKYKGKKVNILITPKCGWSINVNGNELYATRFNKTNSLTGVIQYMAKGQMYLGSSLFTQAILNNGKTVKGRILINRI